MTYRTLVFQSEFFDSLLPFAHADQKRFVKALRLLDEDERHPSLRVHQLGGELNGLWSASASDDLRIEFVRDADARKILVRCSRHYR